MRYRVSLRTDVGLEKTMELETNFQRATIPRLGQGGEAATSRRCRKATEMERTGWLVQLPINRRVGRTAPSAPAAEASRLFFSGRSHPALTKAGNSPASSSRNILDSSGL